MVEVAREFKKYAMQGCNQLWLRLLYVALEWLSQLSKHPWTSPLGRPYDFSILTEWTPQWLSKGLRFRV